MELKKKKKKAKLKAEINSYCWSLVDFIGETNIFPFLQEQDHHLSRYVLFFFFVINTSACFHEFIQCMGIFVCIKRRMTTEWN